MARKPKRHWALGIFLGLLIVCSLINAGLTGQLNLWQSAPWAAIEVTATGNQTPLESPGCRGGARLDANQEAWVDVGQPDGIHVMVVRKDGDLLITPPANLTITGGVLEGPTGTTMFIVEPSLRYGGRAVRVHGANPQVAAVTVTCNHGP
ncbi:MAG: hypothetical protein WBO49_00745 [Candidatus Saccharimonas sp.]